MDPVAGDIPVPYDVAGAHQCQGPALHVAHQALGNGAAGEGVLHVTDDVELFAHAAVDSLSETPPWRPAESVKGAVLEDACRWFAFRVARLDASEPRTIIDCEIVDTGRQRDFFGFNRAKHAVIEAAILATRVEFLPADEIRAGFASLAPLVTKTAGDAERRAFDFLQQYVEQAIGASE